MNRNIKLIDEFENENSKSEIVLLSFKFLSRQQNYSNITTIVLEGVI